MAASAGLACRLLEGVTIQPITRRARGEKSTFGAHDRTGRLITDLSRPLADRWCTPATFQDATKEVTQPAIYGGILVGHYGLFLLESLSRYWALREHLDLPIYWNRLQIGNSHDAWSDWMNQIFKILSLDQSKQHIITEPTLFSHLVAPQPGFQHFQWLHPIQAQSLGIIGVVESAPTGKIWLSRSGLPNGFSRIEGEVALEAALAEQGWNIVHPEKLQIPEQVGMFTTADIVAGFSTSAFHNVLMQKRPTAKLRILLRDKVPMKNYEIIADMLNLDQRIIDIGVLNVDDKSARTSYRLIDLGAALDALIGSLA